MLLLVLPSSLLNKSLTNSSKLLVFAILSLQKECITYFQLKAPTNFSQLYCCTMNEKKNYKPVQHYKSWISLGYNLGRILLHCYLTLKKHNVFQSGVYSGCAIRIQGITTSALMKMQHIKGLGKLINLLQLLISSFAMTSCSSLLFLLELLVSLV